MTFYECFPWLKMFFSVTRDIWYPGCKVILGPSRYLEMHSPDGTISRYRPNDDDLEADDFFVPAIDDPGLWCCICGKRFQHEDPIVTLSKKINGVFMLDIKHRGCPG